jgi:hypothetical protein
MTEVNRQTERKEKGKNRRKEKEEMEGEIRELRKGREVIKRQKTKKTRK